VAFFRFLADNYTGHYEYYNEHRNDTPSKPDFNAKEQVLRRFLLDPDMKGICWAKPERKLHEYLD